MSIRKNIPQGLENPYMQGSEIARDMESKRIEKLDSAKIIQDIKKEPQYKTRVAIEALGAALEKKSLGEIIKRYGLSAKEVRALRDLAFEHISHGRGSELFDFKNSRSGLDKLDRQTIFQAGVEFYVSGNSEIVGQKYGLNERTLNLISNRIASAVTQLFSR